MGDFSAMMKGVGVGPLQLALGVLRRDKRRDFWHCDQIYGISTTICVQYRYYNFYHSTRRWRETMMSGDSPNKNLMLSSSYLILFILSFVCTMKQATTIKQS